MAQIIAMQTNRSTPKSLPIPLSTTFPMKRLVKTSTTLAVVTKIHNKIPLLFTRNSPPLCFIPIPSPPYQSFVSSKTLFLFSFDLIHHRVRLVDIVVNALCLLCRVSDDHADTHAQQDRKLMARVVYRHPILDLPFQPIRIPVFPVSAQQQELITAIPNAQIRAVRAGLFQNPGCRPDRHIAGLMTVEIIDRLCRDRSADRAYTCAPVFCSAF